MSTVKARYDGKVFIPETPVNLPVGFELEIVLPNGASPPLTRPPLAELAELVDQFPTDPDWPKDAAIQIDHYLYGTLKRS